MNALVNNLKASATLALNSKAKKLLAQGEPVINLTTGEPDFKTSERIQNAGINAIRSGKHFYTPSGGIEPLRHAIAKSSSDFYKRSFETDNVIVCNGGKQALFNALFSILDTDDEVIVLKPFWVSYPEMVKLCKGKVVFVDSKFANDFTPDLNEIKKSVSSKTKAIIINSPSNPSSQVFSKDWIEQCLSIISQHAPQAYVLTDDIYGKLILDESDFFSAGMSHDFDPEKIIIINGLSKTYSMTGWRVGWALADSKLVSAMTKVQSQTTANVNAMAQWAAVEAVSGDQNDVKVMRETFIDRKNDCLKLIDDIPNCKVLKPRGGFYFFFDVNQAIKKRGFDSDVDLCTSLLEEHFLALVPGSAFGKDGFLRMSFAANMSQLTEGLQRLKKAFS